MHSSLYPYGERTLARVHRGQWLNPLGHKGQARHLITLSQIRVATTDHTDQYLNVMMTSVS